MAEIDVFERSLASAFLRLADDIPGTVDASAVAHRVALEHPRRRTMALRWRMTVPNRALALLVLAGLLTALLGGALLVGSQMQRRLSAVVPPIGQRFECPPGSTPDKPGPADQAWPPKQTVAGPSLAFDRRAGKMVVLTGVDIVETWTFDVCTNTWTRMHPDREPPAMPIVYDVDSDLTVGVTPGRVWAYDLEANTWTEKGPTPPLVDEVGLLFHDPVSGQVVALADDDDGGTLGLDLWSYEVETDTWTPIPQAEPLVIGSHFEFFAYDAAVDRLVAYAYAWKPAGDAYLGRDFEARTWLFNLRTGTWSGTGAVTPPVFTAGVFGAGPGITYDEAARRTVLLGQGHAVAYDAAADRWETLYGGSAPEGEPDACGTRPECRQLPFMVYDPVNERLVVYGGSTGTDSDPFSDRVSPGDVLAFDTRTREWTDLLEASAGQPAP